MTLGLALRAAREAAGLSQNELVARSGISQQWISAIETDYRGSRSRPRQKTIRRLVAALGLGDEHPAVRALLDVATRTDTGVLEHVVLARLFATSPDFRVVVRALMRSFDGAA